MTGADDADGEYTQAPPAALRQLVRDRSFAPYFIGNLISNTGNWFKDIAAAIFVFELTGSATMVAGVAVTGYATSLVLAPVGGAMADRFNRLRLLANAHLIQATAVGTLLVAPFVGWSEPRSDRCDRARSGSWRWEQV